MLFHKMFMVISCFALGRQKHILSVMFVKVFDVLKKCDSLSSGWFDRGELRVNFSCRLMDDLKEVFLVFATFQKTPKLMYSVLKQDTRSDIVSLMHVHFPLQKTIWTIQMKTR